MFCLNYGMIVLQGNCLVQYYCVGNVIIVIFNDGVIGDVCFIGYYCLEGIFTVIFCDLGYYIDIIFNFVCDICLVGKYCIIGFNFQVCFVGFYCFEGIGYVWQFCLVGIFNLSIGLFNLIECI